MSDKQPPASQVDAVVKPRAKKVPAKKVPAKNVAAKKATPKKTASKTPASKPSSSNAPAKTVAAAQASRGAGRRTTEAATPQPDAPARAASSVDLIRVPMAVRWRDLDAFNHVNNSKYLSYLEEARLHWMLRLPGQGMDDHVAPVVAAAQLNYRRPITWPAEVAIEMFVERLGNTSLSIGHRIVDNEDASIVYCDGNVVLVWIDRDSGRPADLPEAVRDACSSND